MQDIKQASSKQSALIEIESFDSNWEENKALLSTLSKLYSGEGEVPFSIWSYESDNDFSILSPEQFNEYLKGLRSIEIETQRNIDLEMGHINNPSEFEPHDDDWA